MRKKISAKDVKIGDRIIIDPTPLSEPQENPYFSFDNKKITVEEITTLPDGGFYFIYGGDQRDSIYVPKAMHLEISLKSILKRL